MKNKLLNRNYIVITLICQLLFTGVLNAQTSGEKITIGGKVTDVEKVPIAYVNIMEKGTKNGVLTDFDGNFKLVVTKGKTVVFSYMGFKTIERVITKGGNLSLVMTEEAGKLDEVVITALGIKRERKALGYSVQEIKGEEIALSADSNIVNGLAGKVAGMYVTGGTSGMGGSSNITIRGNSNLSGNNLPLFVIDGIPLYNEEVDKQSFWDAWNTKGTVDFGDPISKVNPEDIAEISILKGAGATALYGSRASNGVILITTKQGDGVKQGIGITYTLNAIASNPVIEAEFQQEYGAGQNGQYEYTGNRNDAGVNEYTQYSWGRKFDKNLFIPQFRSPVVNGVIVPVPWVAHPNNVDDFLRTGLNLEHNLALSFNGKSGYGRVSLRSANESGMVPDTDEQRTNLNASFLGNLTDKWKVETNVSYSESGSDNRVPGWGNGVTQNLMRMPSNFDMKYINSVPHKNLDGSMNKFTGFDNPYWSLKEDFSSYQRRGFSGRVGLRYEIMEDVEARVSISKNYSNVDNRSFGQIDLAVAKSGDFFDDGDYSIGTRAYSENNYDFSLFGSRELTDLLDLSFTVGANKRETYSSNWRASVSELATPDIAALSNGLGTKNIRQSYSEKETQSVFGLLSFGYNDYLYLDITGRNDWSSTLPSENRSYFYPAVSSSFLLTEAFDIKSETLRFLKLRASWAQVGSDTSPYQLTGTYGSQLDWNGRQTNAYTTTLPALGLKPQRTNSIEFGTEINMFNNRLNFDIAYYKTNTKNQIVTVGIPRTSGVGRATINAGNVQNKGIEFMVNGAPIKTKDFQWNIIVNAAKNENRLVELSDEVSFIRTGWHSLETRVTAGEKYGDIYGYSFMTNPDGRKIIQDDGRYYRSQDYPNTDWDQYLGNAQPNWVGGLTNTFRYKNFRVSTTINARFGGVVYSQSNADNAKYGLLKETVGLNDRGIEKRLPVSQGGGVRADGVKEVKDSSGNVTGYVENDTYLEAETYYNWLGGIHEAHLFDASYIKLQQVTLTYQFPKEILKPLKHIQRASLSLSGYNLGVLKSSIPNVDPEVSLGRSNAGQGLENGALPAARRIGFRLNVEF